jgi:hypothetical protein
MAALASRTNGSPFIAHFPLNRDRNSGKNIFPLEASRVFTGRIVGPAGISRRNYSRFTQINRRIGARVFRGAFMNGVYPFTGTFTGAKDYLLGCPPASSHVLLLKIGAPADALSEYISQELSVRLVNGRNFTLLSRNPEVLRGIDAETHYRMQGNVGDETAASIGRQLGAQAVISGSFGQYGGLYRLNVSLVGVESAQVLGRWAGAMQNDQVLTGLLAPAAAAPREKPARLYAPLEYGRQKYEKTGLDAVSPWYYDIGRSNRTSYEQTSVTRARQNLQADVAANIASEFKARLDITERSFFKDSAYEDVERLIQTAVTNSIKTRIPRYEALEFFYENGRDEQGRAGIRPLFWHASPARRFSASSKSWNRNGWRIRCRPMGKGGT